MRLVSLRKLARSLPQVTMVEQWGGEVYKVCDKMFLLLSLEGGTLDGVVFKCPPDDFDGLTELDGITQAPYFAKRHWVRLSEASALPPAELERRIRESYALVVAKLPKTVQANIAKQS